MKPLVENFERTNAITRRGKTEKMVGHKVNPLIPEKYKLVVKPNSKPLSKPNTHDDKPSKRKKDNDLKICTWNVRTLYKSGNLKKLINELEKHTADITAVQEMRWCGQGILQKNNCDVMFSCNEKYHTFGTGFIVNRRVRHLVIDFKPINMRLCVLRVRSNFFNISIINAHAPTEEKDDDEKDKFYDELERAYDQCPKHDVKICIGDYNAKIGKEPLYRGTIGLHSLHDNSSKNGVRLINFATSKNMVIRSTCFEHKNIHKVTWRSPNFAYSNQIDHVLVDSRHASNILDVRTHRGANIDSDHYLIVSKFRARISNEKTYVYSTKSCKFDVSKLQEQQSANIFKNTIQSYIREKYEADTPTTINDKWNLCHTAIHKAADKLLITQRPPPRNGWFDKECEKATEIKNVAYKQMLQDRHSQASVMDYKEKRRREKKIHKAKKKSFENNIIKSMENNRLRNESRYFYKKVNDARKDFKPRTKMIKGLNNEIITSSDKVLDRWAEYFNGLLNTDHTAVNGNEEIVTEPINEEPYEPPSLDEVIKTIYSLKNNKAPGSDGITSELVKSGGSALHELLHQIIVDIWNLECMPEEWNVGLITPLHKKGSQLDCENYRGITLLNIGYKVLSVILNNRLNVFANSIIGQYQCGFRRNKSTSDQIFILRQILEKCNELSIDTHHLFIDFKQAYDSINRIQLYKALEGFNIPNKLIRLIQLTMANVTCAVKIQNEISKTFRTNVGLRQGDGLACTLFNLALENVIRKSCIDTTGTIFNKTVQLLAYADDIDIIGRSKTAIEDTYRELKNNAQSMGLNVNKDKTKYLHASNINTTTRTHVYISDDKFQSVSDFVYLGSMVNNDANTSKEIERRVSVANKCYYGLRKHLSSKLLSRTTKIRLYVTLILPVLTYACETWSMSKKDELFISSFERKILRKIFGAICENGEWRIRTNNEIYLLYNEPDVVKRIKIARMQWAGHIVRADSDNPINMIMNRNPEGRRLKGRPKLRWIDNVEEDFKSINMRGWRRKALERDEFKKLLEEAKTHPGL